MNPSNRVLKNAKYDKGVIYRGTLSTGDVIQLAKVAPLEGILEQVSGLHLFEETDPTLCTESCEVFGTQEDMFINESAA